MKWAPGILRPLAENGAIAGRTAWSYLLNLKCLIDRDVKALLISADTRGLLQFPSMQSMDGHIARLLNEGWEMMTETSHSGNSRGFRPFAKRDTITVSFRKPQ